MSPSAVLSTHQLSLYNTSRMLPEQVIAAFAVRQRQFEHIVADIVAEQPKSRPQHHLVVGQRGMGKTMLLARLAAEVRSNPELSSRFIPLVFAEEQYAVDRLSKFWLNCLDSLADAHEAAGDTAGVARIDATVSRLSAALPPAAKDDQPFADEVYDAFIDATTSTGRRPVLLVDNLQLLFERIDEQEQHALRELLMRSGSPILIGTSPTPPPQARKYRAPFYDHFKIHYLRPLDEGEMRKLLVHLADIAQRDDVRQRVLQHPGRLTVLRQLTGGNPRTTLTLFFLYAEDFAPTVFGDLEGLLDRVTPLYKARFEELTPQQQVVASAIANHWDPVTAVVLGRVTGLPAGTISSQLDRLEKIGFVERTELFGDVRTGYQLAERFFNIWFLMRSASRRQRREVEFLTRFLESFYEPADRDRLAQHLMLEHHFSADRYVLSRAVAATLTERETAEELTRHAELTALQEEAAEARARLRELIDFDSLPAATLAFDDLRKKLTALVPADSSVSPDEFAREVLGSPTMFRTGEREQLVAHGEKLTADEIASVLESIRTARSADEAEYSAEAVKWFSHRLANGQIRSFRDAADWNRALMQAPDKTTLELLLDSLPDSLSQFIDDSTVVRVKRVLEPTAESDAWEWEKWGYHLEADLARDSEAEQAFREALRQNPENPWFWVELGSCLELQSRDEEAEVAYRQAIPLDRQDVWPWIGLGNLYQDILGRFDDAEAAYRKAIEVEPLSSVWSDLGRLLEVHLSRYQEAAQAYRKALELEPEAVIPWIALGDLYFYRTHDFDQAAEAYEHAKGEGDTVVRHKIIFLRRDFMGEGVDAKPLFDELDQGLDEPFDELSSLQKALFASYDQNWGLCRASLSEALVRGEDVFGPATLEHWLVATAVLLHLNYGAELLEVLTERGDVQRLRPWADALRALNARDRRVLKNSAPEIRSTAEVFFDRIETYLHKLPEATRRRPELPSRRRPRAKRSR